MFVCIVNMSKFINSNVHTDDVDDIHVIHIAYCLNAESHYKLQGIYDLAPDWRHLFSRSLCSGVTSAATSEQEMWLKVKCHEQIF